MKKDDHWHKPAILDTEHTSRAVAHLQSYFDPERCTGALFERLDRGGDSAGVAYHLTASDLAALPLLSVRVTGYAVRDLLTEPLFGQIRDLLIHIPPSASIATPSGRALLAPGGPADELWHLIRGAGRGGGSQSVFGSVKTSKLLARKRPHLIPIYDKLVRQQFGAATDANQWADLGSMFEDRAFVTHLESLRRDSGIGSDISLLRVMDVAVWMEARSGAKAHKPKAEAA